MSGCGDKRPAAVEGPSAAAVRAGAWETAEYFGAGLLALGISWLAYGGLAPFSKWFTFSLLALPPETRLSSAVEFIIFDGPKVLLLLPLVVGCVFNLLL